MPQGCSNILAMHSEGESTMNNISIAFTRSQIENLIEFFDMAFCQLLADFAKDRAIDGMEYLIAMCNLYTKLSDALKEDKR